MEVHRGKRRTNLRTRAKIEALVVFDFIGELQWGSHKPESESEVGSGGQGQSIGGDVGNGGERQDRNGNREYGQ